MIEKIKADFIKNWLSWTGLVALLTISPLLLIVHGPTIMFMFVFYLTLSYWVLAIEIQYEKKHGFMSDEERSKPYDNWEGLDIPLPRLPSFRRGKK